MIQIKKKLSNSVSMVLMQVNIKIKKNDLQSQIHVPYV